MSGEEDGQIDLGFTHIALTCSDLDRTAAFYARYGGFRLVHEREDEPGVRVGWLADGTRPFCIVFLQTKTVGAPLGPFAHLGVALESRAKVDAMIAEAQAAGVTVTGPFDYGPPVGYGAFLQDPDGHTLEISYGQKVAYTLDRSL
ncbi:MAG: VOC family protein [Pseudomonadota bacterium]